MKKNLRYLFYSLLFFLPTQLLAQTASHVVISEMYGGGGNGGAVYTNDFIELYNPTSANIDISGWSVAYASAAGTTYSATNQTIIPAGTTIKAHGYFLIQEAAGSGSPGALPTPDLIGTVAIGATAGKIVLLSDANLPASVAATGSNVVDFLGFGTTATTYEGTGPSPAPSNSTSVERKAFATSTATTMAAGGSDDLKGNGYDSNDNSADFFVPTVVNPQNSSSPTEPAVAATPTLTPSPTTLTFSQIVSTTSAAQTFTLTGTALTASATLTTAAPYAISTDNITYGTTATFTAAQLATAQTVYVKFSPTATGAASGSISIASTGATTQTVTLNGTGTSAATPTVGATPTSLAFSQAVGSASAAQSFSVSGTNIPSTGVTVTVAAPYTVSASATGTYGTSVTFTQAQMAAAQTVYVQFTPTAVGAANGTATVAATGATSQTVTLNGTGISAANTAPTLSAISDVTLCYTSAQQIIALSGITPGSEATQTVVLSITSTNPALFSQLGVFPIVGGTTGQINYTIAPNASGTAVVTVTVKDNGGTANGGVDTYTRNFNITVNSLPNVNIVSNVGTSITKGVTAQLTATAGGTTYAWSPAADIISGQNTATVTVRPKTSETFTVVVTNALGCQTTQTIALNVSTIYPLVTSNIITPNGDGKNDTWIIKNIDYYPASTVKVVDKAGKVVFTTTNYLNDWAGTYNGQPLTQGSYYYVIDLGPGAPKYTGYITILRD